MNQIDRAFYRGIAAGVAPLVRDFDQPTMAQSVLDGLGVSLDDLREAGVDGFDLGPLESIAPGGAPGGGTSSDGGAA